MECGSRLSERIAAMPFFDSHSHMAGFDLGGALDDKRGRTLAGILTNDYLAYLAGSCCDMQLPAAKLADADEESEEAFKAILPLLDVCRGLSTYAAYREAIRELHPFEGDDITLENWEGINRSIVDTYRHYGERGWQREVIRRAGVFRQVQICHLPYVTDHWRELPAEEREAQAAVLAPSLILDGYCFHGWPVAHETRTRALATVGRTPTTHQEYRDACGAILDRFVKEGGSSVKLLSAYVRTLRFEDVPDTTGAGLFSPALIDSVEDGPRPLQDNMVWALLEMARDRNLPLLVHTGYAGPTDQGDPEHLRNLLQSPRLKGLKIGLCHSGWPNEGKAMMMVRAFRHCMFDMSWTPLLSPTLARSILGAAIDMIPMNKIMVGTDCGSAECFYGTVMMIRDLLAGVLSEKIADGQFAEDIAVDIAERILYRNACEFFGEDVPTDSAPCNRD